MKTVDGKIKPTMALFDCGMISLYYPTQEPVKSFVAKLKALEAKAGVLSVCRQSSVLKKSAAETDSGKLVPC